MKIIAITELSFIIGLCVLCFRLFSQIKKFKTKSALIGQYLELDHSWLGVIVTVSDFYKRELSSNHYDGRMYLVSLNLYLPTGINPCLVRVPNEQHDYLEKGKTYRIKSKPLKPGTDGFYFEEISDIESMVSFIRDKPLVSPMSV